MSPDLNAICLTGIYYNLFHESRIKSHDFCSAFYCLMNSTNQSIAGSNRVLNCFVKRLTVDFECGSSLIDLVDAARVSGR